MKKMLSLLIKSVIEFFSKINGFCYNYIYTETFKIAASVFKEAFWPIFKSYRERLEKKKVSLIEFLDKSFSKGLSYLKDLFSVPLLYLDKLIGHSVLFLKKVFGCFTGLNRLGKKKANLVELLGKNSCKKKECLAEFFWVFLFYANKLRIYLVKFLNRIFDLYIDFCINFIDPVLEHLCNIVEEVFNWICDGLDVLFTKMEKYPAFFYFLTIIFSAAWAFYSAKNKYGEDFNLFYFILLDFIEILAFLFDFIMAKWTTLTEIFILLLIIGFYLNPRYLSINFFSPRVTAMAISLLIFALTLVKLFLFDFSNTFEIETGVLIDADLYSKFPSFFFAIDPISLIFGLLVSLIFPIIILTAWEKITIRANFFYFNVILLELLVLGAFYSYDLLLFFVFFESLFIPISLIILVWGSRQRKVKAVAYIFLYTMFGSVFFLTGILYLYYVFGSTNYFFILNHVHLLSTRETFFLWWAFFIPFAIKIPMFPFHLWLLEAHVEAPTAGSIALAAVLLKIGGYGFIRFLIPLFYDASLFFSPFVVALAMLSIFFALFAACRQTDIKKIIAYSSIAHMNFCVIGIFSFNINSLYGSIVLMIGHGLVSAGLFFLAGVLYDRYHTRTITYYGGLAQTMPVFSAILFYFVAANVGFPCALSFIGEFFLYVGILKEFNLLITLFLGLLSCIGIYVNMFLFISVCYGSLSSGINNTYQDLTPRELLISFSLIVISILTFLFHVKYSSLLTDTSSLHFILHSRNA